MKKKKQKEIIKDILWYIAVIMISLITIYPFIWMIATSLKPEAEIYNNSMALIPNNITFEHYKEVFNRIPFGRYFMNSTILAVGGVITNIFFGSLGGYALAKLRFRYKKPIFYLFLGSMMIPSIVTMIPLFLVLKNFPLVGGNNILGQGGLGFINSYWAILLPGAAGAFALFFMKQFFETLPTELAEAGRIDGCTELQIFTKIYFPLLKPGIVTLGIMTFQSGWNSFMWPLIVLNSEKMMTVQVGLSSFQYNYSSNYGALMAGTLISIFPTLLLFVVAQKYYVQGIAFTGNK